MDFMMLWLVLGLAVVVSSGIHENLWTLGMGNEDSPQDDALKGAACLTLMVMFWPFVLVELLGEG